MTYAELGEKVKAKYPEYENVGDLELGQRTAQKYPEYASLITEKPSLPVPATPSPFSIGARIALQQALPIARFPAQVAAKAGSLAARGIAGAGRGLQEAVGKQVSQQAEEAAKARNILGYRIPGGTPTTTPISGLPFAVAGKAVELGAGLIPQTEAQVYAQTLLGPTLRVIKSGLGLTSQVLPALLRATSGIPEKSLDFALRHTDEVFNAPTKAVAGKAYGQTLESAGLKGGIATFEKLEGASIWTERLNKVIADLRNGVVNPQELINAREAANKLLGAAKFQSPDLAVQRGFIAKTKSTIDDLLLDGKTTLDDGKTLTMPPIAGLGKASRQYAMAAIKEEFQSLLPRNRNLSPNVLRTLGSLSILSGVISGKLPAGMLTYVLASAPKAVGLGIRGAAAAGKIVSPAVRLGIQSSNFLQPSQ